MDDLTKTCGASTTALAVPQVGALGPCVLRMDHDGPVHQAADGSQWTQITPAVGSDLRDLLGAEAEVERLRFEEKHLRAELAKADAENNAAGNRAKRAEDHARYLDEDVIPPLRAALKEAEAERDALQAGLTRARALLDTAFRLRMHGAAYDPEWMTWDRATERFLRGDHPTDTTGGTA
jgi:hypothetical protein